MLRKILSLLLILSSLNLYGQRTWKSIANDFALSLAGKVCSFSNRNVTYSYTLTKPNYYRTRLDLTTKWEGVVSTIFDPYETFTIKGYLECNNDGTNCTFTEYYRTQNVTDAENDNTGGLLLGAAIIGGVAYGLSSDNSSSPPSSSSSSSNRTSSNDYVIGDYGTIEVPFSMSNGEGGWIGGVFFRNKYILRYYVKVADTRTINGEKKYELYCYDAKVGIDGSFASLNEIKGYSAAEEKMREHITKIKGKTLTFNKGDFTEYNFKKQ